MVEGSDSGLTPMLRQYLEIKEQHKDAILFFRLGDFYEMFFDDAVTASKILDIALTSRNRNEPNPVPLCGIPYHAASGYISKLIEKGKKVAICEQVEDPATAKGIVKREVVQVITPGLITELEQMRSKENNYLVCFQKNGPRWGVSFLDLLTGDFKYSELSQEEEVLDLLSFLSPQEILYPESERDGKFLKKLQERFQATLLVPQSNWRFDPLLAERLLKEQFQITSLSVFDAEELPTAKEAAGALLYYVKDNQKLDRLPHLRKLERYEKDSFLWIGQETRRNLELEKTVSGESGRGTLLSVLDQTLTAMGGRLLREQLVRPLIFVSEIEKRLETVGELKANRVGREKLREGLTRIRDIERLAGKIALQNVTPRDLIMLKESCRPLATLQETIRSFSSPLLRELTDKWDLLSDLKEAIEETLVEEPPLSIKEGGILRPEVSPELAELREMIHGGKESLLKMESRERERSGISSLKIKFNRVFGYYIEITNTHLDKIPENYIRKQTLVNAERFITPELKEYETKVLSAKERISQLEYQLFVEFREKLLCFVAPLQEQARRIAWLDFFSSLAEAAFQFNYNRPQISEEKLIRIHEGRHPVIERLNPQEPFFPNDILLDGDQNRFLIITGPNMSGKSTIMRQTAIIVLMAQLGSFVPATEATVGIVDKLFTRVGARDDLSRGASTFMVEMQEASKILHQATDRSLILLDEIGRGTSTFDGISIAWAMSEEIHNHLRARTLFATHYHELTDLALTCSGVKNYNVAVKLEGDDVLFLRKLVAGGASRSYGIAVAKMAGLPPAVLKRANEVLKNLEKKDQMELFKK